MPQALPVSDRLRIIHLNSEENIRAWRSNVGVYQPDGRLTSEGAGDGGRASTRINAPGGWPGSQLRKKPPEKTLTVS